MSLEMDSFVPGIIATTNTVTPVLSPTSHPTSVAVTTLSFKQTTTVSGTILWPPSSQRKSDTKSELEVAPTDHHSVLLAVTATAAAATTTATTTTTTYATTVTTTAAAASTTTNNSTNIYYINNENSSDDGDSDDGKLACVFV
jgi:hypothetical protein